ncbi:MAG: LysR family transcriptional regulator [Piscinibacter sp.]|uniref:LysR family transcriptional regulator n=1 Tax=Piscinibacter sp. TaxID=1903157 RepID=UPI00258CA372|nr:LysR family transcriptional regulator [Piscinibacter sp.]MCW5667961.1 LysR family transcriptional regulator [Piscinibacter sp.]
MNSPSVDALLVFAEAAAAGSFSAAARALGRSQSTVSTTIANLEVDLGVALFDRSTRKPTLTEPGRALLARSQEVIDAARRLDRAARALAAGTEVRLTVALSDTYASDPFEAALGQLDERFPDLQLECLIAECDDVVALVRSGRVQLGVVEAQPRYPAELLAQTLAAPMELGLYVAPGHALARARRIDAEALARHRALRLTTIVRPAAGDAPAPGWSAPSYLMLMELAQLGFGWAALPRWLVQRYGGGRLKELRANGWPRRVALDLLSARQRPLGPAGQWLQQVLAG